MTFFFQMSHVSQVPQVPQIRQMLESSASSFVHCLPTSFRISHDSIVPREMTAWKGNVMRFEPSCVSSCTSMAGLWWVFWRHHSSLKTHGMHSWDFQWIPHRCSCAMIKGIVLLCIVSLSRTRLRIVDFSNCFTSLLSRMFSVLVHLFPQSLPFCTPHCFPSFSFHRKLFIWVPLRNHAMDTCEDAHLWLEFWVCFEFERSILDPINSDDSFYWN